MTSPRQPPKTQSLAEMQVFLQMGAIQSNFEREQEVYGPWPYACETLWQQF